MLVQEEYKMIIWFRNSILASVISLFSCVLALSGFGILRDGEPLAGIILMAAGIGGILTGKLISDKKAEKRAVNQQADQYISTNG